MIDNTIYYDWTPDTMVEVTLEHPDNFLKVKETLTRIGVASRKQKQLYQSCHILHKQGRYFIVHFKELFILDGKESNLTLDDIERRNAIVSLLLEWNLVGVVDPSKIVQKSSLSHIKIISFIDKEEWDLCSKYTIGSKKNFHKQEEITA